MNKNQTLSYLPSITKHFGNERDGIFLNIYDLNYCVAFNRQIKITDKHIRKETQIGKHEEVRNLEITFQ